MPPGGLPETFLEGGADSLQSLVARFAKGRGPFTTAEANEHFGIDVEPRAARARAGGAARPRRASARAAPSASGATRTSCGDCAEPRSPRLRKEVEPAEQATLRTVPAELAGDRPAREPAGGARPAAGARAAGLAVGERGAAAARSRTTSPPGSTSSARPASSSGSGAGLDRVAVYFREDAPALGRLVGADPPEGEVADRIREVLGQGAEFWFDLLAAAELEAEQALPALWDLVWSGEVTNDAWTPLRAGRRYGVPRPERRPRRFSRRRSTGITATQGRWSLDRPALPGHAGSPRSRGAAARAAGDRHAGRRARRRHRRRLQRGLRRAEGARDARPGRRGYFVEGLGGAQFALGGAVERLRELRPREGEEPDALVLAAADPAQPYGAALPWPKLAGGRAARVAGAQVVLLGGEPALFVERGGSRSSRSASPTRNG